jgi:hypothetical protein
MECRRKRRRKAGKYRVLSGKKAFHGFSAVSDELGLLCADLDAVATRNTPFTNDHGLAAFNLDGFARAFANARVTAFAFFPDC